MKILQTTEIVKNGEIKVKLPHGRQGVEETSTQRPQELSDGEVDVIVVTKNEPDDFEELRQTAQAKVYDSEDKILELIYQVKQEMLTEKGRTK